MFTSHARDVPLPVNILHLTTTLEDGAGIAALRQHRSLLDHGTASRVLVAHGKASATVGVVPAAPAPRWHRAAGRLGLNLNPASAWSKELRRLEQSSAGTYELFSLPFSSRHPEAMLADADIAHLHWISGLIDYPDFFSSIKVPIVWTLHDQNPYLGGFHYADDSAANPLFARLDERCRDLKRNALQHHRIAVAGNSDWNTRQARESGVFPKGTRFETIYYPLDTAVYTPRDKAVSRELLNMPATPLVVGFASASLSNRRKGFTDLIAALAHCEATKEAPAFSLLSFGREPDEAARSALRSPWHHLGFITDDALKTIAYSAMDVLVVPSRAEAFGQTAIEALACGTPVIAANVGGIPETMPADHHAWLFPPGDTRALAHKLIALLAAPETRRALATTGRAHVVRQHNPQAAATALNEIYNTLLKV